MRQGATKQQAMEPVPLERLRKGFGDLATVEDGTDYDPPILSKPVRSAVFQWLAEMNAVEELKAVDVKPRRSAILAGPPGCGKTTLAKHVAQRLGVPLVVADMQMLSGSHLGETGRNIAKLFSAASEWRGHCVLLLDEFDALANKRSSDGQAANKEMNAIVVAFLQRIDTFDGTLIAASNKRDLIDPAIWRRFGMHLDINVPDEEQRFAIIARYLQPFKWTESALELIVDLTAGATPALLRQLMEGVKRDLVLSPKFNLKSDCVAVFERTIAAAQPHDDLPKPPLWEGAGVYRLADLPWPPERVAA